MIQYVSFDSILFIIIRSNQFTYFSELFNKFFLMWEPICDFWHVMQVNEKWLLKPAFYYSVFVRAVRTLLKFFDHRLLI